MMRTLRDGSSILGLSLLLGINMPLFGQTETDPHLAPGSEPLVKRRVLHFLPDYGRVQPGKPVAALSAKQKFQLFTGQTFDPSLVVIAGALAGLQQAGNLAPAYGQGGEAYAKRFGAMSATLATSSLFTQAVMPTLFHQDPRYFRKGSGSVGSRLWYAISRTVITRQDSGKPAFNYSQVSALAASTALSNAYYPDSNRTASLNASRFGIAFAVSGLLNVLREFRPAPSPQR